MTVPHHRSLPVYDMSGREHYNYFIPPKAQDVSHWWRPYYEYKEFHVAVYAMFPISNEDMYHFIRDELTVSEDAGRLLGRAGNWRCSSGRLEDVVRQHVTLCNDRLHELDEANDDSEDEEAEWYRKPVVCICTFAHLSLSLPFLTFPCTKTQANELQQGAL